MLVGDDGEIVVPVAVEDQIQDVLWMLLDSLLSVQIDRTMVWSVRILMRWPSWRTC